MVWHCCVIAEETEGSSGFDRKSFGTGQDQAGCERPGVPPVVALTVGGRDVRRAEGQRGGLTHSDLVVQLVGEWVEAMGTVRNALPAQMADPGQVELGPGHESLPSPRLAYVVGHVASNGQRCQVRTPGKQRGPITRPH